jgi:RNA polymerase sigma factor (sigma-70 family)
MSRPDPRTVLSQIHRLAGLPALENRPDRELLESYRQGNDETAFAVLVRRHGPLVWGTCRRLLGDCHDTEDAYQAVFLVLARKAGLIRRAESLAAWLHRVARQVALKARARRDRRCKAENGRRKAVTETHAARAPGLSDELSLREALAILDEEIERLPDKFRAPIVLCYLQGRTNEEAARELGCPAGTLKFRLSRARELLGERLGKRGVAMSAGVAAVLLATSASEAALVPAAARAAAARFAHDIASAPANVGQLAGELMKTMTMNKMKLWAAGFLALVIVGAGAGTLVRQTVSGAPPLAATMPGGDSAPADEPKAKADLNGDSLPAGAVVRLGTVRWRHGTRGNVVAFAACGKEVVTGGPDGLLRVWDLATGRELRRLGTPIDHEAPLRHPSAVSASGRWAATSGKDGVHVWDVESGKELRQIKVEKMDNLMAVGLTPDGKSVLLSSHTEGVVLWDVATGKEQRRFEVAASRFVFSPDGKYIATPNFAAREHRVRLWDVATGKEVWNVQDETVMGTDFPPGMMFPAFSPDGKVIARVALDGTVHLHDAKTGKEQRSFGGAEKYPITGLVYSPDGKSLAALRTDRTVQLFDPATGKVQLTLDDGHERSPREEFSGPVFSADLPPLAFAPDGKTLAAIYGNGWGQNVVRLWDTATGKPLPGPSGHAGGVADLALTADGKKTVTVGADRTLRQWDTATGKEVRRDTLPAEKGIAVLANGVAVLSKTGRLLAYPADKETIALWDVTANKEAAKITLPPDGPGYNNVGLASFSADEKVLATADQTGTVRLWDTAGGKEMQTITVHKGGKIRGFRLIQVLEFSPDGKKLLTVQTLEAEGAPPPGGKPAVPPPEPKSRACLWDTATGRKLRDWEVAGAVSWAAFTTDGRSLATAAGNGVTLWETATGKERGHVEGAAALVAVSPDGGVLAASDGATIRLLSARTFEEIGRFKGHDGEVKALSFTRDGKGLVSGSADSTALVWDVARLASVVKIDEQSAESLAKLWADLANEDAARAYRAALALSASPKGTAALLAKQVKPAAAPEPKQVAQWLKDLDNNSFEVREKAAKELEKVGNLGRPALEEALKNNPSAEARRRIEDLLDRLGSNAAESPDEWCHIRAVEVLERMATPEAKKLLEEWAKGPPAVTLTREASASLRRLGK